PASSVRTAVAKGLAKSLQFVRTFLQQCDPRHTRGIARSFRGLSSMEPTLDLMLRAFVHAWPAAVVVFDRERRVLYSNPSARALFGTDLDRSTPVQRAAHATLRDRAGRLVASDVSPSAHALRGTTVSGGEYQLVRADGSKRRVIIDAYPIRDAQGNVVAAACVIAERADERRVPEYRLFEGIANWLETTESGRAPSETVAILTDTVRALAAS